MDIFFEQIITRKRGTAEKITAGLTVFFGVLLILLLLAVAFLNLLGFLSFLCIPLAFGAAVALYFVMRSMGVEFEYSLTNGDFDVDRIIGKRKRQRMLTTKCSDFAEFGIYDAEKAEKLKNFEFEAKVLSANLHDDGLYYAIVNHSRLGRVLLVIEPNDRIKTALRKFIPRSIRGTLLDVAEQSEA